jgi:hypothetical protein
MPKKKEIYNCNCGFFCNGKPELKEHICEKHLKIGKKKDKLLLLSIPSYFDSFLKQKPIKNQPN